VRTRLRRIITSTLAALALLLVPSLLPAEEPTDTVHGSHAEVVLLSFHPTPSVWMFFLVSPRQYTALDDGFAYKREPGDYPTRGQNNSVSALLSDFGALPRGALITWRHANAAGTEFPPISMIDEIRSEATARGLRLSILRPQ
jgi:hypothetical protein